MSRKTVARAAGVSEAVVSWVMSGKAEANRIRPETIRRVRSVAERLGYRPSVWGKLFKTRKSGLLAFVSSDLTDPTTSEIVKGIGNAAQARGYGLMIFDVGGQDELISPSMQRNFQSSLAEGYILHTPFGNPADPRNPNLFAGKPFCIIGKNMTKENCISVEVDNEVGAELAVRHLLADAGCRRLGILADRKDFRYTRERMAGVRRTLKEFPLRTVDVQYRSTQESQTEAGLSGVRRWAARDEMPDGIFAMGDTLAFGALTALNGLGIDCPKDVKVVGFDGTLLATYSAPPLTTVAQPFTAMSESAVTLLTSLLKGHAPKQRQVFLPPTLVVRESTARRSDSPARARHRSRMGAS